jgi:hypothetical protein
MHMRMRIEAHVNAHVQRHARTPANAIMIARTCIYTCAGMHAVAHTHTDGTVTARAHESVRLHRLYSACQECASHKMRKDAHALEVLVSDVRDRLRVYLRARICGARIRTTVRTAGTGGRHVHDTCAVACARIHAYAYWHPPAADA